MNVLDDGRGKQVDKVLEECSEILHAMLVRHQDGAVNLDYRMFHRCVDAMTECHRLLYVDNGQGDRSADQIGRADCCDDSEVDDHA